MTSLEEREESAAFVHGRQRRLLNRSGIIMRRSSTISRSSMSAENGASCGRGTSRVRRPLIPPLGGPRRTKAGSPGHSCGRISRTLQPHFTLLDGRREERPKPMGVYPGWGRQRTATTSLPDPTPFPLHVYCTGSTVWQPVVAGHNRFEPIGNACSSWEFRVGASCAG